MRCGRCNSGQPRAVVHHRHAELCDYCTAILGVPVAGDIRAEFDFHLASDPRGSVVGAIIGILREARV
jgi:hypothetical protein